MRFEEALRLLKEGKKVRRHAWAKGCYIAFDEDSLLRVEVCGSNFCGKYYFINKDDIDAVWEEYKEPLLNDEEKELDLND